ncbi:MAG: metallophosphoesterase, partial [Clostridia bacterium]
GSAVSKTYTFRPVDESDGLQIYAESDIHDYNGSAIKSAQFYGDKLDLYVLAGDISSSIIYNKNLEFINKTAYEVTKGEIPVVYARGNHETKNKLANQLYKYVGSVNEDFYYTFRLGSLWGVVLDMGEDHNDDWWEFFGAADFDAYRQKQVEFLDKVIDNADEEYNAEGVKTRVVICHEALAFSIDERNTDKIFTPYLYPVFCQLVDKLNTMNIDFCISGHNHQIMYLEGNEARGTEYTKCKEYLGGKTSKTINIKTTGANFPTAIISRKSETQLSATVGSDGAFIGTAFEIIDGRITLRFTNHIKEVISTISPWKDGLSFGKEIVIKG